MGSATQPPATPVAVKKRKRDKKEQENDVEASGQKSTKRSRRKSKAPDAEERKLQKLALQLAKHNEERAESQEPENGADDSSLPERWNALEPSRKVESRQTKPTPSPLPQWKVSEPMGGRIADVEPIFSQDQKHLIITYDTSIQVYSTADSLLVRRIRLSRKSSESKPKAPRRIVSSVASLEQPDIVWAADSTGTIWKVDWTTGSTERLVSNKSTQILAMAVANAPIGKKGFKEIIVTSETDPEATTESPACQIVAYTTSVANGVSEVGLRKQLQKVPVEIRYLRATTDGTELVGAGGSNILVASVQDSRAESFDDLAFSFYSFDTPDEVCSLDARADQRRGSSKKKPKNLSGRAAEQTLDLVVGCARGSIFVYSDILAALFALATGGKGSKTKIHPRKYHWHPRAVHSVKWSLDGEYLISGGSENTLVLWQVDTGKLEFLPHLQASIESIVVSPSGSSYAITLDDNSAMVISTAEMKPTTYISGMQSLVVRQSRRKDASVNRVWVEPEEISRPLTAAVNPADSNQLFLCVGNGQMASATDATSPPSASLLQVFDMSSFQSLSKQPLARTNPTDNNITPRGYPVTEPWIPHLAFSRSGDWLATVDEWQPPVRDVEVFAEGSAHPAESFCEERKEVHLKFWKVEQTSGNISLDLVSRLDEAHFTTRPESILGLAASPKTTLFSTLGADGNVRFWAPHTQSSSMTPAAVAGGKPLGATEDNEIVEDDWSCVKVIPLASNNRFESEPELMTDEISTASGSNISGALAFSDDGSTLFVAAGLPDEVVLYIIDAASGEIQDRLDDVVRGEVRSLQVLGSSLIILGGNVVVYDVVEDRLRYGVSFDSSPPEAVRMTHLAVDKVTKTFALSVPVFKKASEPTFGKNTTSEIAVFSVDDESGKPRLVQTVPHLVTALLAVPGPSGGFVAVDSAAHVSAIIQGTANNPLALPLTDLQLENVDGEADADGMELDVVADQDSEAGGDDDDQEMLNGVDRMDEDVKEDEQEEDLETHNAIIVPERLTEIFDGAPAFALPPIEDLFYRVSSLVSPRPIASSAA